MKRKSLNHKFICDLTNIKEDGCYITWHGAKVGFVTSDCEVYLDTDGKQLLITPDDLRELIQFADQLCSYITQM